ncbi:MAG: NAD(P)/FAD-dependent oxidoreductase, partial [Fervidobacterium sp.]
PVLRYKEAAPNGKAGIEVSLLFDYELTTMVYKRGWYEDFKQKMSEYIIDILNEKIYENLKEDIIFTFASTPMTIRNIVGSSEGAIVGWSFEQDLPIESSMIHMAKAVETPFKDVYVAGQWTFSPAGGPTAIMTGRMAANRCMRG